MFNNSQIDFEMKIPVLINNSSTINNVNFEQLEFGKVISDHMLVTDYKNGKWEQPIITPYQDISLAPTALCFHYGQTVFEGMKAFKMKDGNVSIFRIDKHYERFNKSLERMCMPAISEVIFREGIMQLVQLDMDWVRDTSGASLYIRPFMIATEERFGVKVSSEFKFIIFTGPVAPLHSKPIRVKVETHYVRAAKGGTGSAKCGGNYGAAFYPTQMAKAQGYDAVLWTDSLQNKFIEESGTMNVMFVIDNILITPPLSDSILDGITRDSLLTIANDLGIQINERVISCDELEEAITTNNIQEAFGTGTAAIVALINVIGINHQDYELPGYSESSIMFRLKKRLEGMRVGSEKDIHNWNTVLQFHTSDNF